MARMIKVTGKGKISVKPDMIRLHITQQSIEENYEAAILESADKKGNLNSALGKLGFEKSDLKTVSFNISTEYESYQGRDKSWKRRLIGYKYTHRMKLEFPADNELLGKVLLKVARCPGKPEFSIEYTVADPEKAKNELLGNAIKDARAKAEVLTSSAGVHLLDVQSIDYSWGEINFVTRPVNELMLNACCEAKIAEPDESIDLDIEADDINVTDTVTVVWEIS